MPDQLRDPLEISLGAPHILERELRAGGVASRGRTPLWNATPGLYDVLLRSAHARLGTTSARVRSVAIPLFRFGAASLRDTAMVTFVGDDSARLVLRADRDFIIGHPQQATAFLAIGKSAPPAPFVPEQHRLRIGHTLLVVGFGTAAEHATIVAPIRNAVPPSSSTFALARHWVTIRSSAIGRSVRLIADSALGHMFAHRTSDNLSPIFPARRARAAARPASDHARHRVYPRARARRRRDETRLSRARRQS